MLSHRKYLFALMLIACTSCAKKQFDPVPEYVPKPLNICDCDVAFPEYLRGTFNNTNVCFNSVNNPADTFSNAYYTNRSIHLDHINLMRENINHTMSCQIYLTNTDLHNKILPYTLPHADPAYNEQAKIILSDLNKAWASNIDEDYVGDTFKGFSITITDTSGGYFRGTFKGMAATRYDKRVLIDGGSFNIKVISVDKNN